MSQPRSVGNSEIPSRPSATKSHSSSGEAMPRGSGRPCRRSRSAPRLPGPARDLPGAPLAVASASRCSARAPGVGVVEDDGRRRSPGRWRLEAVAQLDRAEGIEAHLLEGPVGLDLRGGGVAEDGGGLERGPGRGRPSALGLGQLGEQATERAARRPCAAGTRPGRAGSAPGRRLGAGARRRGGVEVRPAPASASRQREGGVEERQAPLGGISAKPRRWRTAAAAPAPPRSRARRVIAAGCSAVPQAPGERGGGQAFGLALRGERVEEDVGGGVVGLAGAAEHAGGRGEEDEVRRGRGPCSARAGARRRRLGAHDALEPLGGHRLEQPSSSAPAAVDDRAQGVLAGIAARSSSSASRSETSQAAIVTSAPSSSSSRAAPPPPLPPGRCG